MTIIQSTSIYWVSDMQSGIEGTIINELQALALECLWEERLKQKKKKNYIEMRWVHFFPKIKYIPLVLKLDNVYFFTDCYFFCYFLLHCYTTLLTLEHSDQKETLLKKIWMQFFQLFCFNLLGYCSCCLFITWKKKNKAIKNINLQFHF